jgi:hypothetical protein
MTYDSENSLLSSPRLPSDYSAPTVGDVYLIPDTIKRQHKRHTKKEIGATETYPLEVIITDAAIYLSLESSVFSVEQSSP